MNDARLLPSIVTNPPLRQPREAWRIRHVQFGRRLRYLLLFGPGRAASKARYMQPPAYETDTSASCQGKTESMRQASITTGGKTTYSLQWTGAWHIAPLCQHLVCGVHVLDGTETHEDMSEENAHTEARDARCLDASELKQSIFSSHYKGDVRTGLGQRGQDPRQ